MKVLLAHNHYRSSSPSGEDAVFRNERQLLIDNGSDVISYERFNDDIDESSFEKRVKLALDGAWSRQSYKDISALIRKHRPTIAHFHNTFPQISPSAYKACQDNGVPVVQTLHNYRFICPAAVLMRDGKPCEECIGTSLLPALRHRCYRGSLAATGAQVWTIASNRWRGTYRNQVNRYIALTQFAARKLAAGGLPGGRIEVKPNFLPEAPPAGKGEGGYAVYVGRLSEEKGVRTLLTAWKEIPGLPLKILGDGPLRQAMETQARQDGLDVEFLGFRAREDILDIVGQGALQIVPSEWYEGFPMVILEAYACGTPVVASRIGSLEEIIVEDKTGVKFEAGNIKDLAEKVNAMWADKGKLGLMRHNARMVFDQNYTDEKNFAHLMGIYQRAIEDFKSRGEKR